MGSNSVAAGTDQANEVDVNSMNYYKRNGRTDKTSSSSKTAYLKHQTIIALRSDSPASYLNTRE